MPTTAKPIDWIAFAADAPTLASERQTWEERQAIELERLAIEEAIQRAIHKGSAEVAQPYRPPRSILQNRYLPAIFTIAILLLGHYLGQR